MASIGKWLHSSVVGSMCGLWYMMVHGGIWCYNARTVWFVCCKVQTHYSNISFCCHLYIMDLRSMEMSKAPQVH